MPYTSALTRRIQGNATITQRTNPSLYDQLYGTDSEEPQDPIEKLRQQMAQEKVARYAPRNATTSSTLKPLDASSMLTTQVMPGALTAPYQRRLNNTSAQAAASADFAEQQQRRREAAAAALRANNASGGGAPGFDVPNGSDIGSRIVAAAMKELGLPYVWGGGGSKGPSKGVPGGVDSYQATHTVGFDCSGLVQYAYAQVGLKMPRVSYGQLKMGSKAALNSLRPGDLVGFGNGHHIGIYIGGGKFIEAPHTGAQVRVSSLKGRSDAWGVKVYH